MAAGGLKLPAATDVADVIVAFVSVRFARASQDVWADVVRGRNAAISIASQMYRMTPRPIESSCVKSLSTE
jgi:hypothetical protein